ncbi:hypothetical protein ABLG96_18295 [Nakamurella sp. A5-74]|uniref:Uncharacterized protein n=1 Tax=Nakamurella sp. A5-74 TaxID=3158264 RepID=A0AAU8DMD0_9ACTN
MTTPQRPSDPHQYGAGGQPPQPDPDPRQGWLYGLPAGQFPPPLGSPVGPVPGRSAFPRILIAVLLAAVVGLGVFLFVQSSRSDPTAAPVGACLEVVGTTTVGNPESAQTDCGDPGAQFEVTETGSSVSCDRLELSYVRHQGDGESEVTSTVCLRPHFEVGECYVRPTTQTTLPRVGPCSDVGSNTEVRVDSLHQNSTSGSVCSSPSLSYTYVKRRLVVCLSRVR